MKKFLIALATLWIIPALYFSSCNKIKELVAFDVLYSLPPTTFTYPAGPLKAGEELLYSGMIEANLDSILTANGLSSGFVGNTQFIACSISIIQPSGETFGWLHSAYGEISENADFTPAQVVGSVENNDPNAQTVVLTLNNTNIRPYLGSKYFYFRIFGVLNGPVPGDWVQMLMEGELLMRLEPLN